MHHNNEHHQKGHYKCEGECGAHLTEDEYRKDTTKVCGDENCSHHGKLFVQEQHHEEHVGH